MIGQGWLTSRRRVGAEARRPAKGSRVRRDLYLLKSRGFWIGMAVSLVLVGLFVRSIDFAEVRKAFVEANYALVLLCLPVYAASVWLRTLRWQYILRPVKRVPARRLFPVVIIGLMGNNLIPARAGELVRAYVLGQREKISKATSLGTIAVDRVFDGITLVPMLLIVAAFVGGGISFPVGFRKSLSLAELGIVMAVLFGAALALLFYVTLSDRGRLLLHGTVQRLVPSRLRPGIEQLLQSFTEGLDALRSPVDLALAAVMSFLSWILEAGMYYIVALAFGIHEGFYVFVLLMAACNLAMAVVASQGGIGPFELVVSRVLLWFGVTGDVGSAYAIGLHAMWFFPVVALGLYFAWSTNVTLGEAFGRGAPDRSAAEAVLGDRGVAVEGSQGVEVAVAVGAGESA
jgi:uncharacterized protein (TIRG00374 family)